MTASGLAPLRTWPTMIGPCSSCGVDESSYFFYGIDAGKLHVKLCDECLRAVAEKLSLEVAVQDSVRPYPRLTS